MKPFFVEVQLKHKHDIIIVGFIFHGKENSSIHIFKPKLDLYKKLVKDKELYIFVREHIEILRITFKQNTYEYYSKLTKYANNIIHTKHPVSLQEVNMNEEEMVKKLIERYL